MLSASLWVALVSAAAAATSLTKLREILAIGHTEAAELLNMYLEKERQGRHVQEQQGYLFYDAAERKKKTNPSLSSYHRGVKKTFQASVVIISYRRHLQQRFYFCPLAPPCCGL